MHDRARRAGRSDWTEAGSSSVDALALLGSLWALAAGVLAPGWLLARGLALGRDALERFVLAAALGRLALAAVTLLATSTFGARALHLWAVAAALGFAATGLLGRRRQPPRSDGRSALPILPVALTLVAAGLLVHAFVGRSGLAQGGQIAFFGRDTSNDPLVYVAMAFGLHATGLPLTNPFAAGLPVTTSYAPYGVLAGLHEIGAVPMLDLALRVLPCFDVATLGLGAAALLRALGAPRLAWTAAPVLLLLGGDAGPWLEALGPRLGLDVAHLDTWAFFGPYFLAFNPIAAALQTLLAGLLLLVGRTSGPRRAALGAGLLFAGLFELKLFLWAPALAALVAVAWLCPPPRTALRLRWAAGVAVVASLPSLVEKALWARALREEHATGFAACVGCLPRYLMNAALGSHDLSPALFRTFRLGDVLSAGFLFDAARAGLVVGAIALGARWLAVPTLVRLARGSESPGRALLARWLGVGSGTGLLLAGGVGVEPHPLNAAQFAWIASFGLWLAVALAVADWAQRGRWLPLGLVAALALPGSLDALVRLGWRAPPYLIVNTGEAALMDELARRTNPTDVVFEPSMIDHPDRPSPVAWLAGRPVYLSLLSAVLSVPDRERERRFADLLAVFVGGGREEAMRALRASGASWLLVPLGRWLPFEPGDELEVALRHPAGTLYRLVADRRPARSAARDGGGASKSDLEPDPVQPEEAQGVHGHRHQPVGGEGRQEGATAPGHPAEQQAAPGRLQQLEAWLVGVQQDVEGQHPEQGPRQTEAPRQGKQQEAAPAELEGEELRPMVEPPEEGEADGMLPRRRKDRRGIEGLELGLQGEPEHQGQQTQVGDARAGEELAPARPAPPVVRQRAAQHEADQQQGRHQERQHVAAQDHTHAAQGKLRWKLPDRVEDAVQIEESCRGNQDAEALPHRAAQMKYMWESACARGIPARAASRHSPSRVVSARAPAKRAASRDHRKAGR